MNNICWSDIQLYVSFWLLIFKQYSCWKFILKTTSNGYLKSSLLIPLKQSFVSLVFLNNFGYLKVLYHLPNNVSLTPVDSACNLDVFFDKNLSSSQLISAISKSCLHRLIRYYLRRIRDIPLPVLVLLLILYLNYLT